MNLKLNTDKCTNCHACISVCPVQFANKIVDDHVEIDENRCISCGRCVSICSDRGHYARTKIDDSEEFIENISNIKKNTIAIVAPAIFASYPDTYLKINAWLKSIGVHMVFDVSFGAELTVKSYLDYIEKEKPERVIAQPCPVIVNYITKYKPELISDLAPVMSPMMHTIKYAKAKHKTQISNIVVISPCIAKRDEFKREGEDVTVITFESLDRILDEHKVDLRSFNDEKYDNISPDMAVSFASPGGLLKSVQRYVPNISAKRIEGENAVYSYLDNLSNESPFLCDALNCEHGCAIGTGTKFKGSDIDLVEKRMKEREEDATSKWKGFFGRRKLKKTISKEHAETGGLDNYRTSYKDLSDEIKVNVPSSEILNEIYTSMLKVDEKDIKNCQGCGYGSCETMATAVYNGINKVDSCHHYQHLALDNEHTLTTIEKEKVINISSTSLKALDKNIENINSTSASMEQVYREGSSLKDINSNNLSNISGMNDKVADIQMAVSDINLKLDTLLSDTNSLNDIITSIRKIMRITKTLSVNASIEATKAGVYGKGFGVVARNIRELSENVGEELKRVELTVKNIQKSTSFGNQKVKSISKLTNVLLETSNNILNDSSSFNTSLEEMIFELTRVVNTHSGILEDSVKDKLIISSLLQ